MSPPIRPNHNQRSSSIPVDDELEAVITTQYVFNSGTGEWEPQILGPGLAVDPVSIKDSVTPANRLAIDVNGRVGINNFPAPPAVQPVSDNGNSITVDGTVALDAPSLAALESISIENFPAVQTVKLDQAVSNYVSPTPALKTLQGKFFLSGTGKISLAAAGNLRVLIKNPAASGKNMVVVRMGSFVTAIAWAELFINPTAGLPASAVRPRMNAVVGGGLAPVGELTVDTSLTVPLSGGIATGLILGMPAGNRVSLDFPPFIIAPGVSLGVNVPFTGAAEAALAIYWYEE